MLDTWLGDIHIPRPFPDLSLMKLFRSLVVLSLCGISIAGADPFAELVRPTDPLTPAEQQKQFKLPPGFEIQLVASEPALRKPMNMQWDVEGRLWITESREYPYAIKDGTPGRDTVTIFSDFGPDGKAKKIQKFAEGLNIPIGLYPFRSPSAPGAKPTWKCLVWSIPNIWLLEDTDGDGKADKKESLYGPLGWERDTHGNLASFRRGPDGWIYGTHGFNNNTTFKGKDGSEIKINSGNTYRIKTDGSRVEQHTWGQVNPFGLCWDDYGNLFSADCHSSPIYQLLREAYYPSFGKPHDGLGYAPLTVTHDHGSTAICGPIYISDPAWPAEYQDHMLVGNVQTSRLNHDLIEWKGASSKGKELPDFLSTKDPWFRPVDIQWGPDGALYIADFYNKIIGHYEVPLDHPGRDRERGRLWRIVYKGPGAKPAPKMALPTDVNGLIGELGSRNPTRRTLALTEICDRIGAPALPAVKSALAKSTNPYQKFGLVWALYRLGGLDDATLAAAIKDKDALVRAHALRAAREVPKWSADVTAAVRAATLDENAIVKRCSAEALAAHPAPENVQLLLSLWRSTPKEDDHLIHSTRIALRNQLRSKECAGLAIDGIKKEDHEALMEIMLAVPGEQTALLRLALFERVNVSGEVLSQQLPSMLNNLPADKIDAMVALARKKLSGDVGAQAALIKSSINAFGQRGISPTDSMKAWGEEVANAILAMENAKSGWSKLPVEGAPGTKDAWHIEQRPVDGGGDVQVISSKANGETATGIIRSFPFELPEKLRFQLVGQDGQDGNLRGKKNNVRLLHAGTGEILRETPAPGADSVRWAEWDLKDLKGKMAYVEVMDSNTEGGFAWIGVGRFEPEIPQLLLQIGASNLKGVAADIARGLKIASAAPKLAELLNDGTMDADTRARAGRALVTVDENSIPKIADLFKAANTPAAIREKVAAALGESKSPAAAGVLVTAMQAAPYQLQLSIATALAGSKSGAETLIKACEDGKAAPVLLRDKALSDRLNGLKDQGLVDRANKLTEGLPAADEALDKLIAERREKFDASKADVKKGETVFVQNCGACHAIGGKGGNIGPQLDGVGGRGAARLLEDILDPNRNVDLAFRQNLVTKKDGSVYSGLFRREEGEQIVFADLAGQETRIAKSDIASRKETAASLMPAIFGQSITPADFDDMLAYLLSKRVH